MTAVFTLVFTNYTMWFCSNAPYKDMCTVTVGHVRAITTSITGNGIVSNTSPSTVIIFWPMCMAGIIHVTLHSGSTN